MTKHPKAGNSGYSPGQGRTFTPSISANWTQEFNQLMQILGKSRNEMTEDLIQDGLVTRKGSENYGLLEYYSEAEIEFLKNPIAQKVVKDYYALLTNATQAAIIAQSTSVTPLKPQESVKNQEEQDELPFAVQHGPITPVVQEVKEDFKTPSGEFHVKDETKKLQNDIRAQINKMRVIKDKG